MPPVPPRAPAANAAGPSPLTVLLIPACENPAPEALPLSAERRGDPIRPPNVCWAPADDEDDDTERNGNAPISECPEFEFASADPPNAILIEPIKCPPIPMLIPIPLPWLSLVWSADASIESGAKRPCS
jgi:hypothetical protein